MSNMPQTVELNIVGQVCPSCLLLALRAVNQHKQSLQEGNTHIVIFTDDRQAISTIPAATEKMGYHTNISRDGSTYRIQINA